MINKAKRSEESIWTVVGVVIIGAIITGVVGILLALVSMLSGDYVGAGILLVASALAFGLSVRSLATMK